MRVPTKPWPTPTPRLSLQAGSSRETACVRLRGIRHAVARGWLPYQRSTFVTPASAGYFSGHSTFSRSAADVLAAITGSPYFPGGFAEFVVPANHFLQFEIGPSQEVRLQWASYFDAADQAGQSRLWGGIHPRATISRAARGSTRSDRRVREGDCLLRRHGAVRSAPARRFAPGRALADAARRSALGASRPRFFELAYPRRFGGQGWIVLRRIRSLV